MCRLTFATNYLHKCHILYVWCVCVCRYKCMHANVQANIETVEIKSEFVFIFSRAFTRMMGRGWGVGGGVVGQCLVFRKRQGRRVTDYSRTRVALIAYDLLNTPKPRRSSKLGYHTYYIMHMYVHPSYL